LEKFFAKIHKQKSLNLVAETPVATANCQFKGRCTIGAFSYIGADSTVSSVDIGRYCSIATGVIISPTEHPNDRFTTHLIAFDNKGPFKESSEFNEIVGGPKINGGAMPRTTIGHDVWIGANVIIRRGLSIGHGAIIGAGSLVTRNIKPYEIVGGIAAKLIRPRFDEETVNRLLALNWWLYDLKQCLLTDTERGSVQSFLKRMEGLKASGDLYPLQPTTLVLKGEGQERANPLY
jgi:acetyltransferase-like isoleucine patch superfamily enzyme